MVGAMKLLLLTFMLTVSVNCMADEFHNSGGITDTGRRELLWQAVNAVDWMQTRTIATDERWYEVNPILGKHPTLAEVNTYFVASALFHTSVSHYLSRKHARMYQNATTVVGIGFVLNNHIKGIRLTVRYWYPANHFSLRSISLSKMQPQV